MACPRTCSDCLPDGIHTLPWCGCSQDVSGRGGQQMRQQARGAATPCAAPAAGRAVAHNAAPTTNKRNPRNQTSRHIPVGSDVSAPATQVHARTPRALAHTQLQPAHDPSSCRGAAQIPAACLNRYDDMMCACPIRRRAAWAAHRSQHYAAMVIRMPRAREMGHAVRQLVGRQEGVGAHE